MIIDKLVEEEKTICFSLYNIRNMKDWIKMKEATLHRQERIIPKDDDSDLTLKTDAWMNERNGKWWEDEEDRKAWWCWLAEWLSLKRPLFRPLLFGVLFYLISRVNFNLLSRPHLIPITQLKVCVWEERDNYSQIIRRIMRIWWLPFLFRVRHSFDPSQHHHHKEEDYLHPHHRVITIFILLLIRTST